MISSFATKATSNTLVPLILRNATDILDICMMNKKAFEKTTETKQLWIVHPTTQKVVANIPEVEITAITDETQSNYPWIEAYTSFSKEMYVNIKQRKASSHSAIQQKPPLQEQTAQQQTTVQPQSSGEATVKTAASQQMYSVLETLHNLLLERKAHMPEGSYSSYLFSKGEEKIKKKLGEEAIELLLAKSEEEICNEAADVLYHLWVYAVEKNITPLAIVEVLYNRLQSH